MTPTEQIKSNARFADTAVRVFGDDIVFWRVCAMLFGACAMLKGLRAPNPWALTQAQLNYSHGFIKRGLSGAIYGALGLLHRRALSTCFFLELAAFFVLLGLFSFDSHLEERFSGALPIALFSSSYAVTFLTHLVGYTDILGALFTIPVLAIRNPNQKFIAALFVTVAGTLVHESFLFLFLPVIVFSLYVDGTVLGGSIHRVSIIQISALCAIALVIVLSNSIRGNLSVAVAQQTRAEVMARADFPVRQDFFDVLSFSMRDNLKIGAGRLLTLRWYGALLLGIFLLGPTLLCLLVFIRRVWRQTLLKPAASGWIRGIWPAALSAIFLPEVLNFFGMDEMRWHVLTVLNAFLVLCVLSRSAPRGKMSSSLADKYGVLAVIALSMAAGYGLYGDPAINPYPFFPRLLHP